MSIFIKIPFYAKASLVFIGLFAFVGMLFIAQSIIVPVIYSTIIAIVLSPIVNYFVRKRMNRIIAIGLTLVLVILLAISIIFLLYTQASLFGEAFPKLIDKFHLLLNRSVAWSSDNFNINPRRIDSWVIEARQEIMNGRNSLIRQTLMSAGNVLIVLVLIPVYIFMILYYQPLLLEFVHRLFSSGRHDEVNEVLTATKKIIQSYLVGLLLESIIIAILNSIGLLLLGIDYAILLGVIGAMVNIIPYIGGIISVTLPVMIAIATKPSLTYAILVMAVYIVIQFIDNHFIMPKVVASKVKINALVSIIAVLVGGALWGIPGMFLSIPMTAIMKVIFDHIDPLKPWGFVLGDAMPGLARTKFRFKRKLLNINPK